MVVPEKSAFSPLISPLAALCRRIGSLWDQHKTRFRLARGERHRQWVRRSTNEDELTDAVITGAYPKLLLPEMLHVLDIRPDRVESEYPGIGDDLEWVCARCADKTRCRRELDNDTADLHYREFCANAHTLEALVAEAAGDVNRQDPDETEAESER